MKSEDQFIKKIRQLAQPYGKNVVAGIGDDASVLEQKGKDYLLVTCDAQVEGVHFEKEKITPDLLAKRAVAAALSDIAAMGGIPDYLLTSIVLNHELRIMNQGFLDKLYRGFQKACLTYNVYLIGGNLSKGKQLVIDITVLGHVQKDNLLLRSGAKTRDAVLVTGSLGNAAKKLSKGTFFTPKARIKEGILIGRSKLANAMIDVSDGLSTDLSHICDSSNVGVRVFLDQLPVHKLSLRGAKRRGNLMTERALHGGEDYELCFTAPKKNAEKLIKALRRIGTKATVIGEIIDKKEGRWIVDKGGRKRPLKPRGWDHLTSV